jgi:hypothetical protein
VDVFLPGPGNQIHDLNPTTFPPVGLFWTIQISDDRQGDNDNGVKVQLGAGNATLQVSNAPVLDYGDTTNALFGGGPPPVPGVVSYKVVWNGVNQRINVRNTNPTYGGFAGEFVRNVARMEWTAKVGDLLFESDPLVTSSSSFAELLTKETAFFSIGFVFHTTPCGPAARRQPLAASRRPTNISGYSRDGHRSLRRMKRENHRKSASQRAGILP